MIFRNAFEPFEKNFSPSGTDVVPTFRLDIYPDGTWALIKTGERNIFDEIQAHLDYSCLEALIARFNGGDSTALGDSSKAVFGDSTDAPVSVIDAQNMIIALEDKFNSDESLKEKYKNFRTFINAFEGGVHNFVNDFTKHFNEKKLKKDDSVVAAVNPIEDKKFNGEAAAAAGEFDNV